MSMPPRTGPCPPGTCKDYAGWIARAAATRQGWPSPAVLAALTAAFPQFAISRETIADRTRYVSRARTPGQNPHTVVTDDPAELRAILITAARPAQ
jgi:hypothetical protein